VRAYFAEDTSREIEARCRIAYNQGVRVTCSTAEGLAAAPLILDYAEVHDIDVIAMSTHGRRGFRRLLLGSVAEEVVQRSSCPVVTLGPGAAGHRPWPQRIVVAVDLSQHSTAPVAYGKELAAMLHGELHLLHVVVPPPVPASFEGSGLPALAFDPRLLEQQAQIALEALYRNAGGPSVPWSSHVEHGVAVDSIVRFAASNSCDLIVVASHGLTGVSHLLMGSVSERVVRQAPCPVFTVKSFGKALIEPATATRKNTSGRAVHTGPAA
jgi:nucleotide-binding universal stress UspA family protein